MERAPLRPVPIRPTGPVDREAAAALVARRLPELDDPARSALALVDLAGGGRDEIDGQALARGRKALRRAMFPLPGSGWCERAELLISDRIDDVLAPPGVAMLDAHLANCARCVEHERRLVQAIGELAAECDVGPVEAPEPIEAPEPPVLTVVQPPAEPRAAEPPVSEVAEVPAALVWRALYALAIVLAVLAAVLAVVGVVT